MAEISHVDAGNVEISTSRLLLRGAKAGDGDGLHQAFGDPEVMKYWSTLPHETIEQSEDWIQNMSKCETNGVTDFVICLKPDLNPIGKVGVWDKHEIGFLLAQTQWRKGLALEALNAIIPYLFNEKGLKEITADADPRNVACIGLLLKLGFVVSGFCEKTFQVGDEWVDSTYLKLTKEKWEEQESKADPEDLVERND
ncbi:hypothetical protein B0A52_09312 [Exophiala mesophila]|uniref:N-acetyltransferase domain-containing protein n=1 Tax=Exophiala mesophila TaxID=212818 RepID=A0A438MU58_EXOME|nr:hypothetical protein B0A52_09312 [Exophiala mesophila]